MEQDRYILNYRSAELRHNPFWGISTTERVPFAGVFEEVPESDLPLIPGVHMGNQPAFWN
jgi:hypothetical protein